MEWFAAAPGIGRLLQRIPERRVTTLKQRTIVRGIGNAGADNISIRK